MHANRAKAISTHKEVITKNEVNNPDTENAATIEILFEESIFYKYEGKITKGTWPAKISF